MKFNNTWVGFLAVVAVFANIRATTNAAPGSAEKPNVVIILADDLGYGDLGCYGHNTFKTPRLDKLAAEGARLTHFNTPAPFCAPTRASLMTGRYPFRCGMMQNPTPDGGPIADALFLPETEVTLAEVLRGAGFATGMVGKWHLGHKPGRLPTDRGFDQYLGIPYSNDMRPVKLFAGTEVAEYPVVQATLTHRYTERAVEFIRRNKTNPFFLYFAQAMPHKPLAASEAYYKKSGQGLYADVISELDASVGSVLDALKETGGDERTLVLFTSDNGPWFGGSSGGLRGMKGSTYEGGFRVPMIARWPGRIPAGHVSHQPAVMMDLFATVLAATGSKLADDRVIDGRDIMPLLSSSAASPHAYIFGHQGPRLSTIRDARWKLHVLAPNVMNLRAAADGRWLDPRAPDGVTILAPFEQYNLDQHPGLTTGDPPAPLQLFDLQNDPSEQHNVAAANPQEVERLKVAFEQVRKSLPNEENVPRSSRAK